jgi:hypothetical protein
MSKVSLDSKGHPTRSQGDPPPNWSRDDVKEWNRWVDAVIVRADDIALLARKVRMNGRKIARKKQLKHAPEIVGTIESLMLLAEMLRDEGLHRFFPGTQ